MRHDHRRGQPLTAHEHWCKACVVEGTTTGEESLYVGRDQSRFQPGMTVEWLTYETVVTEKRLDVYVVRHRHTGQIWSEGSVKREGWHYEPKSTPKLWWIVKADQTTELVSQDRLTILSKGRADVCLV